MDATVNIINPSGPETGIFQGPFLLTWINLNSSMDKQLHAQQNAESNYLSIPKFQRCKCLSLGMDK